MRYFTKIVSADNEGIERDYAFVRRDGKLYATCGDRTLVCDLSVVGDGTTFTLLVDGESHDCLVERVAGKTIVQMRGERITVEVEDERERAANVVAGAKPKGPQTVDAVMPGVVVDILVSVGDSVEAGQTVVILEAMKMQNPIAVAGPGLVTKVVVSKGDAVAGGALLVELAAVEAKET